LDFDKNYQSKPYFLIVLKTLLISRRYQILSCSLYIFSKKQKFLL